MTEWTQIRIPTSLLTQAEEIINNHPELGYINTHELIRDALRDKIINILQTKKTSKQEDEG